MADASERGAELLVREAPEKGDVGGVRVGGGAGVGHGMYSTSQSP